MKKPTRMMALIVAVSLLTASNAQAGAALTPPTKTTGFSMTATIVIDVTQTVPGSSPASPDDDTGLTSITVQKASTVTAAIFTSDYIRGAEWTAACTKPGVDLSTTALSRLTGLIDTLVGNEAVLNALFLPFGPAPHRAAILSQDYLRCTSTSTKDVPGRQVLSFTAVIQFCVPPSINGRSCP